MKRGNHGISINYSFSLYLLFYFSDDTYMKYVGCYMDDRDQRMLSGQKTNFKETNSPEVCVNHCLRIGMHLLLQFEMSNSIMQF